MTRLQITTLDGEMEVDIPAGVAKKSEIIGNLMIDLSLDDNEVVPLTSAFSHLTKEETTGFITIWKDQYDWLPDLEIKTLDYYLQLPPTVEPIFTSGDNSGGWDLLLLGKYIKPANYLVLPKLLNLFILMIAKMYNRIQ